MGQWDPRLELSHMSGSTQTQIAHLQKSIRGNHEGAGRGGYRNLMVESLWETAVKQTGE